MGRGRGAAFLARGAGAVHRASAARGVARRGAARRVFLARHCRRRPLRPCTFPPRRSLRYGMHCKPKAGTNNIFSIGVIPAAAPFDGPGVAKLCKAPDGRVFLLVNFSRRAIIKFFGRITDTAEVKGRFVAVDHDSGVELSGSALLVETLDDDDEALAGPALGIDIAAGDAGDAAAGDGDGEHAAGDDDAARLRTATKTKLFRTMTKRSGLQHVAGEDAQSAEAWTGLFASVFGERFAKDAVLEAADD